MQGVFRFFIIFSHLSGGAGRCPGGTPSGVIGSGELGTRGRPAPYSAPPAVEIRCGRFVNRPYRQKNMLGADPTEGGASPARFFVLTPRAVEDAGPYKGKRPLLVISNQFSNW